MPRFTLLTVTTNECDGSEISKICRPIKWNMAHNLVRIKTIVNCRNCMLVVLVAFFFSSMQRIVAHSGLPSVLKNVIPSGERAVLEYREAVIKNNW